MRPLLPLVAFAVLQGCAPAEVGTDIRSRYVVPHAAQLEGEHWLDHPWPSDARLVDGRVSFAGFHNPRNIGLVAEYLAVADQFFEGYSPVAPGYLRFDDAIDPQTLPSVAESTGHRSSVQLIDVDLHSPEYGTRRPIWTSFRAAGGHYVLPNTLRWIPALGHPLRPRTQYALVVTHALRSFDGGDIWAPPPLRQAVGVDEPDPDMRSLRDGLAPAVALIGELGTRPSAIRHLSVFTTGDPTAEARAIAHHARTEVPAPTFIARDPWQVTDHGGFVEYVSAYGPSPNYQVGEIPFKNFGDGGQLNIVDGVAEVVDLFDQRFSLSVPDAGACPMPEAGYPIVLYEHGTGGSFRSYLDSGYAQTLAEQCLASMGVDQIFHGTRPGAPADPEDVDTLFFNFQNAVAARASGQQSAIDIIARARLFTETRATIPAHIAHDGEEIRFDRDKVLFFGHSQGGLNGPLYLALDDSTRGGVLSGSGAVILITLLEKTRPDPSIANLVPSIFLALQTEEREELDIFHPALMLAQTLTDGIDPINYARHTVREPLPGRRPKSVLMTEGIAADGSGDNYTPPRGTEAQAVAMGLPLMEPAIHPLEQEAYGATRIDIPPDGVSGNLAGGAASGVLAQWAPGEEDGHFVVFDIPRARAHVAGFLRRLADDPAGGIPAP